MSTRRNQTPAWAMPLSVHILAEFVFCPRAAVLALEEQRDDEGEEGWSRTPRLNYLPDFDAGLMEEALEEKWRAIVALLTWIAVLGLAIFIASQLAIQFLAGLAAVGCFFFTLSFLRQVRDVALLAARLRAMRSAKAVEPDPDLRETQPVNWWSLLKAGFRSVQYEDSHEDLAGLGLVGRPWRVLHRGSLRIPVFRKVKGEPKLGMQHLVRMAAYCHLVTTAEGGEAPFSVVLFGRGYDGLAVPNLDKLQRQLPLRLSELREMLKLMEKRRMIPDVPPSHVCHGCHWGQPVSCERASRANRRRVKRTRGKDGKLYHSDCGDRFDWVPPHERAEKLGLREGE